jgi:hypothetical protein
MSFSHIIHFKDKVKKAEQKSQYGQYKQKTPGEAFADIKINYFHYSARNTR